MNHQTLLTIASALTGTGMNPRLQQDMLLLDINSRRSSPLTVAARITQSRLKLVAIWRVTNESDPADLYSLLEAINCRLPTGGWANNAKANTLRFCANIVLSDAVMDNPKKFAAVILAQAKLIEGSAAAIACSLDNDTSGAEYEMSLGLSECQPALEALPEYERVSDMEWAEIVSALETD